MSATPSTSKSKLDHAANVAIIVVCALAVAALVPVLRDRYFAPPPAPPPGSVAQGERYEQIKAVLPAGTQKALVVAVSPACHFCNDSMPFYKQLVDERNQKGSAMKFIAAVPGEESKAEESKKFADAGVKLDGIVPLDFKAVKVPGTPTMLLVDNNGRVLQVWVGQLDSSRQKDVLELL